MFRNSLPEPVVGIPWGALGGAVVFALMLVIGYVMVS